VSCRVVSCRVVLCRVVSCVAHHTANQLRRRKERWRRLGRGSTTTRVCSPGTLNLPSAPTAVACVVDPLDTSGAFYKSKPLETFLRAHCGEASMIDTTCDTSVKTVLRLPVLLFFLSEVPQ
jgi:hypothetical protein